MRTRFAITLIAVTLCSASAAFAQVDIAGAQRFYRAHALVSDGALPADMTDKNLVKPVGIGLQSECRGLGLGQRHWASQRCTTALARHSHWW